MSRVHYVWSKELQDTVDQLPANLGRSSLVHSLVRVLGLIDSSSETDERHSPEPGVKRLQAKVVTPETQFANAATLRRFHDEAYVNYLLATHEHSNAFHHEPRHTCKRRRVEVHGLEHDCPTFDALPRYACLVAAATLTACRLLAVGESDVVINWDGGRHHALRNRASGFCYVADAVLGIMLLAKDGQTRRQRSKPRILYLDLDLHYGDGVAQAFHSPRLYAVSGPHSRPPQVLTLSIHHRSPTFFPPSAYSDLPSEDTSHPFSLSIPLSVYASRPTYAAIWSSVERIQQSFNPDYVVLQLGADGLPRDPIGHFGSWNIDGEGGMIWCVEQVKAWNKPLCVLGGGGYNHANTARAWALSTAALVEKPVVQDELVPEHENWPEYKPSFTLEIPEGHAKDENTPEHLDKIDRTFRVIAARIQDIVSADS